MDNRQRSTPPPLAGCGGGRRAWNMRRPLPPTPSRKGRGSCSVSDVQAIGAAAEDRIAVASNWKLVWWRFRRHHLALFSAGVLICLYLVVLCPTSSHTEPRADRRAPGVHSGADAALLRRWLESLGPRDRRQAQSGDAAHGMDHRSATQGARRFLHARLPLPRSWPVRDQHPSARRHRSRPAHLPARLRSARARPVVAHHARHADLDDRRSCRRHAQRHLRRRARRHLRLFRRHRRSGDPAADRAAAIGPDHPDLARTVGRAAARLDADPGVLRHHRDPVAGRLDHARRARCAAASSRCARRISCWPRGWPDAAGCASSCATWCRPSSATSSPPARSPSR